MYMIYKSTKTIGTYFKIHSTIWAFVLYILNQHYKSTLQRHYTAQNSWV